MHSRTKLMNQETDELVTVMQTLDQGILAMAESLLRGADIRYLVRNHISRHVTEGLLTGTIAPYQIQVCSHDADTAVELLKGLFDNEVDTSPSDDDTKSRFKRILYVLLVLLLIPIILAILISIENR